MTRRYTIIEKIISIILILWGTFMLSMTIIVNYHFYGELLKSRSLSWRVLSYSKMFRRFHLIIFLDVATIFGGVLLLIEKRIGWIISLITLLSGAFILFIPIDKPGFTLNAHLLFVFFLVCICYLTLFFILILKPFREKYSPLNNYLGPVLIITALILADKTICYLIS